MDKKTFTIGILTITAVLLFIANYLPMPQAQANQAVKDTLSEYQMVTARNTTGGESLYIINRDGLLAVFQYDPTQKALRLVNQQAVSQIMGAR